MKRNGLVFVPPESPKRVILYPTQDSTNHPQPSAQQQQPTVNGFQSRPKTALITNSQNDPTTSINANNNARLLQPHPHSSPPKPSEKTRRIDSFSCASFSLDSNDCFHRCWWGIQRCFKESFSTNGESLLCQSIFSTKDFDKSIRNYNKSFFSSHQ